MNGVHDMGGMHGFGPVEPEKGEPVFHENWERRIFGMVQALRYLRRWNLDEWRHVIERMPPARYLSSSYYEKWLHALKRMLDRKGLLKRRVSVKPLKAGQVDKGLRAYWGTREDQSLRARFKPGDRVRARDMNPEGHTRLPRYCRGRRGAVDKDLGVWTFPDHMAEGKGRKPQHVYCVRFAASELWGAGAPRKDSVYVDLWEDYLEPA